MFVLHNHYALHYCTLCALTSKFGGSFFQETVKGNLFCYLFCTFILNAASINIYVLWPVTIYLLVWKCFVSCQLHLYSQFWDSRYRYRNTCKIWYDFIILQFGRCPMGQSTGWGGPDLEAPLSSWPCTTRACAGTASGGRPLATAFSLELCFTLFPLFLF